jgi:hypothetical protein
MKSIVTAIVAALSLAFALAGCAGTNSSSPSIATIARDVGILSTGLQTAVNQLEANPAVKLGPEIAATCRTALAGITTTAAALATTATVQDAQPLVLQITAYANTVIGTVSAVPNLPPAVSAALAAASILMPVIQVAAGFAVPPASAPAPPDADKARAALTKN